MIFTTTTSRYELIQDSDGIFTLRKMALFEGQDSFVPAGYIAQGGAVEFMDGHLVLRYARGGIMVHMTGEVRTIERI